MPRIPAGEDFGRVVAQPMRTGDVPRGVFTLAGQTLQVIGSDLEQERVTADRAQAAHAASMAQVQLEDALLQFGEDLALGQVGKDEADREWSRRSQDIVNDAVSRIPATAAQLSGETSRALQVAAAKQQVKVRELVRAKDRADIRGGLLGIVEVAEREATTNRARAVAKVATALSELGPASGYGTDDQVRMLASFRERAALAEGSALIRLSRDDAAQLDDVVARLKSEEFNDLSAAGLGQLEQQVLARKQYLDHQANARESRARAEQDRIESAAYGAAVLQVEKRGQVEPET